MSASANHGALLREAADLHEQGRLDEAGALYAEILAANPDDANALHLSALVEVAQGRVDEGLDLFRRALERAPGMADAWRNLGIAQNTRGDHERAAAAFAEAVKLEPRDPSLSRLLAAAQRAAGDDAAALATLEAAVREAPQDADLRLALASVLDHLGRRPDAITHLREVAFLRPERADSHLLLGQMLRAEGKIEDAIASLRAARGLDPERAHVAFALADALHDVKRHDEALPHVEAARALAPDMPGPALLEISLLNDLHRPLDALARADAALLRFPGEPALHSARGLALMAASRLDEAIEAAEQAVALAPADPNTRVNLAAITSHACEPERAIEIYGEAENLVPENDPNRAMVLANKSMSQLLVGDYAEGFRNYEARLAAQRADERRSELTAPRLTPGTDIAGKTVLVHTEQGYGDNIQFARFVPMLVARGARVALEVPPGIGRIMASIEGVFYVGEQGTKLPAHDYTIAIMSLPWFLGVTLENLPAPIPYLGVPADAQARWDKLLTTTLTERPRIGIAWSGNPKFQGYATRSIPFPVFNRIRAARPEAKFVILQTQFDAETEAAIEASDELVLARTAFQDFADTAALMNRLDLIISGDTSLVHLAGALGRPTWVLLQRGADWRWLRDRRDSPWYPSLRLFRQRRHGDWDGVIDEVSAALRGHRFEI
jgi:tetratricopeptide (TPR) repeat protein